MLCFGHPDLNILEVSHKLCNLLRGEDRPLADPVVVTVEQGDQEELPGILSHPLDVHLAVPPDLLVERLDPAI